MPDNKKEQEREELHRAIWAITDDLRGSVDGWDFKSYVLPLYFREPDELHQRGRNRGRQRGF